MRDSIIDRLQADTALTATLTGGIHTGGAISRQATPAAFDANGEILPCALVTIEGESPAGPYRTSARQFVVIYLYEWAGTTAIDAALDRIFALLNRHKFAGTWETRWVGDVRDQQDEALGCSLALSRFQVTRQR